MPAACWSRPPGTTADPITTSAVRCVHAGKQPTSAPGSVVIKATTACITNGTSSKPGTSAGSSPNVAVARELAGWCRSLAAPVQQEQPWTDE